VATAPNGDEKPPFGIVMMGALPPNAPFADICGMYADSAKDGLDAAAESRRNIAAFVALRLREDRLVRGDCMTLFPDSIRAKALR
jgi:hypothetical protein